MSLVRTMAALLAVSGVWLNAVHNEVTEPYMDEVFHVGQTQAYLDGRWTHWDPKITTPPGLYVLGTLFRCTDLLRMRALNAGLLSLVAVFVGYRGYVGAHTAFNIALFPPLFLLSALVYTDVASTVSVLGFWACFRRHDGIARSFGLTLLGLLALTFRQTNIFWVAIFPAGLTVVRILDVRDTTVRDAYADDYVYFCFDAVRSLGKLRPRHVVQFLPYTTILACFAAFVFWNGGVVLGDKANHVPTLHFAQMLYLWPYVAFFSLPIVLPQIVGFLLRTLRNDAVPRPFVQLAAWSSTSALAYAIVKYSTVVHPFTLADNRHYVFYVFRILLRPGMRYAAIPVYVLCAWAVVQALASKRGDTRVGFVLVWTATCTLQLSSAPLVEPRYSIVPWIMWRLHVGPRSKRTLWLETAWLVAINVGTGYMFLHRGFAWTQEPGKIQRFMW